jgi:hypothetical protein
MLLAELEARGIAMNGYFLVWLSVPVAVSVRQEILAELA